MKRQIFILLSIIALILSAGCATTDLAPVSRDQIHAFVERTKAEHGANRDQWPHEVQDEFDRLFDDYLSTRKPEVPAHE